MKKEEANSYLHKKIEDGEQVSPVLPEGVKNYLSLEKKCIDYSQNM